MSDRSPDTRPPMLPPADINEELEARLRGEIPRKRVTQKMYFERLEMTNTTKGLLAISVFLGLTILTWMATKIESTSSNVETIKDQQAQQAIKQAEANAIILLRLGGVETEVQGLKSRTQKLEEEIRK